MKVIVAIGGASPEGAEAFIEEERPVPVAEGKDILVKVKALAINPVDTKIFDRLEQGQRRILGWDACGEVVGVGKDVSRFTVGQQVFYAGDMTRDGSNAAYQLVDERLVGPAPDSLSPVDAASLPLTSVTAWEGLFDRLEFTPKEGANTGSSLLVIGGAGGVGSMITQLASWAGITVVATAGRPESAAWCRENGASIVVGRDDLPANMAAAGMPNVNAVFCTTHMEEHWSAMAEVVKPQGRICLIDDPSGPLDIRVFKQKSVRICWEFMFARSLFQTEDMARQGAILENVARLIDAGSIRATRAETIQGLSADNIRNAHLRQRSGAMVGKQVVAL